MSKVTVLYEKKIKRIVAILTIRFVSYLMIYSILLILHRIQMFQDYLKMFG